MGQQPNISHEVIVCHQRYPHSFPHTPGRRLMSPPPAPPAPPRRLVERLLHEVWFGTSRAARMGAAALAPLSLLTARESARRRAQIRSLPPPSTPVVVVGNLVVGGAGKTPLTIAISRGLRAHGHQVGLLCSGYRGARTEARLVSPSDEALEHGDEAVLLARAGCGPVAAGRHRGEAFALLLREHPELTVVVSDDGLQHVHLPRTVELAVFDRRGAGNGRLLPAGPLRESLLALAGMDAIVLNGQAVCPVPHPRVFGFRMVAERFVPLTAHHEPIAATDFARFAAQAPVAALAGIGEPERFFDMLRGLGIRAQTLPLPDHAPLERTLIASLRADLVLMTAKDAVKCTGFADPRCWALEVSAEPDPQLISWLAEVLVGHTSA